MPYADSYLDDEAIKKKSDDSEGPSVAGSGSVVGGASDTQSQAQGAKAPTSSDKFQNLNSYIDANQGSGFGSQFAGKVQGDVDKASQAQQKAGEGFKGAVDQGSTTYNEGLVNDAVNNPGGYATEEPKAASKAAQGAPVSVEPKEGPPPPTSTPISVPPQYGFIPKASAGMPTNPETQNPPPKATVGLPGASAGLPQKMPLGSLQDFYNQRDASYKGPNTFQDAQSSYQDAYGATKRAGDVAKSAQTEGGRFGLLNDYFGKPEYSQGQKSLDNFLVTSDPNAQAQLEQARQGANQATVNLQNQTGDLNNYAIQKAAGTAEARNKTRAALGIDDAGNMVAGTGALGDFQKHQADEVTAAKGKLSGDNAAVLAGLKSGDISGLDPALRSQLGLDNFDGDINGLDLGSYFSAGNDGNINTSTVASAQDQSRIAALSKLAGVQNNFINPDQAGQFANAPEFSYNRGALDRAVADKASSWSKQLSQAGDIMSRATQEYNAAKQKHDQIDLSESDWRDAQHRYDRNKQIYDQLRGQHQQSIKGLRK